MSRLLIIEDDAPVRRALAELLSRRGFEVLDAADGAEALRLARSCHPDFVLCDIDLPDIDGYVLLDELHEITLSAQWYFMTGKPVDMLALQSTQGIIAGFVMKPFDVDELMDVLMEEHGARLSAGAGD